MLDRLQRYSDVVVMAISFCTRLVWIVYAQLLYADFRRRILERLIAHGEYGSSYPEIVGNAYPTQRLLTIRLIATYGSGDRPVGTERRFRVRSSGG